MTVQKVLVELLAHVVGLGKPGDRVMVSSAQARNALIPQKKARLLDEKTIMQMEQKARKREQERQLLVEKRHEYQEKLHGQTLSFRLRWSGDKVYWSVTEHEIIEAIKNQFAIILERWDVRLPDRSPLKKVGMHQIQIHLGSDTYARMSVEVGSET